MTAQQLLPLGQWTTEREADVFKQERDEILAALERSITQLFVKRARSFVVSYLAKQGPASGEDITDACKAAGITPLDDRHFGAVYMWLARSGQIKKAGYCQRRKGHNTGGGNLWELS